MHFFYSFKLSEFFKTSIFLKKKIFIYRRNPTEKWKFRIDLEIIFTVMNLKPNYFWRPICASVLKYMFYL